MEQITIQVQDKEKAKILLELLAALDFVSSIKTTELKDQEQDLTQPEVSSDFFAMAGLWAEREISLETIRQKAWPRQA